MREQPSQPTKEIPGSLLDHPEIKKLIKNREIRPEDFPLLLQLDAFPASLFQYHHNFFSAARERVIEELQQEIRTHSDPKRPENINPTWVRYCELFIEIANKYDWSTALNTNRAFETIAAERPHNEKRTRET